MVLKTEHKALDKLIESSMKFISEEKRITRKSYKKK